MSVAESDVTFHIPNLVRSEKKNFTLIHNVPRCVKLLPCQKITALHTATHALVIRGEARAAPGSGGHVWLRVEVSGSVSGWGRESR